MTNQMKICCATTKIPTSNSPTKFVQHGLFICRHGKFCGHFSYSMVNWSKGIRLCQQGSSHQGDGKLHHHRRRACLIEGTSKEMDGVKKISWRTDRRVVPRLDLIIDPFDYIEHLLGFRCCSKCCRCSWQT